MCRLLLMNKSGEREIEKSYGLSNFLQFLEEQMGGHGNGYALMKKGRITALEKGVKLNVKEIARVTRKSNYDWCIFHTRLASVGEKSDNNCHPFRKGTEVMAMNGTEHSVGLVSNVKEITDTEAILDLKVMYKWELPALKKLSSIFVGFSKGKPYIVADNTYNVKLLNNKKNNAIVFASDFPDKMKKNIYEPKKCFIWNDGPIDMNEFKKYKKKKLNKRAYFEPLPEFGESDYYEDLYAKYYGQQELDLEKAGDRNVA